MITKQQALEFIYNMAQENEVSLNLATFVTPRFSVLEGGDRGLYVVSEKDANIEELVTKFIKENLNKDILKYVLFPIPVDVDMLEVGQTYKVVIRNDGCLQQTFDKEDYPVDLYKELKVKVVAIDKYDVIFNGDASSPFSCVKDSILEIYKVNEHV